MRESGGASTGKKKKVFQTKSHSCQTAASVSMAIRHSPAPEEWKTSNLLHSRCPVKHAFAEAVSGARLAASCQHRRARRTPDSFYPSDQVVDTLGVCVCVAMGPLLLRRCHKSFHSPQGVLASAETCILRHTHGSQTSSLKAA